MSSPADLWNHLLPDPVSGAAPRPAGDLLASAVLHAAHARVEAAGAKAAVAELARQLTAAELDDDALIARMQDAVREAIAEIVQGRPAGGAPQDPSAPGQGPPDR